MSRRRRSGPSISLFSFQDIICSVSGIMVLIALIMALELITAEPRPKPVPNGGLAPKDDEAEIMKLEQEKIELTKKYVEGRKNVTRIDGQNPEDIERKIKEELNKEESIKRDLENLKITKEETESKIKRIEDEKSEIEKDKKIINLAIGITEKEIAEQQQKPNVEYVPSQNSRITPILVQCSSLGIEVSVGAKNIERQFFMSTDSDFRSFASKFQEWAITRDKQTEVFFVLVKPSSAPYVDRYVLSFLDQKGFGIGYDPFEEDKFAIRKNN